MWIRGDFMKTCAWVLNGEMTLHALTSNRDGRWRPHFSHRILTVSDMGNKNLSNTDEKLHIAPLFYKLWAHLE